MTDLTRRTDAWLDREGAVWTRWAVVGPKGAVSFTVRTGGAHDALPWGIDGHHPEPPEHADYCGQADDCELTGGKCWCDGSALMASELWKEALEAVRTEDKRRPAVDLIFARLADLYPEWMENCDA